MMVGFAVVLQGALQLIAVLVLYVNVHRDAIARRQVIDLQSYGAIHGVVITFRRRVAEGPVPERELADAIYPSGVKLSLKEAHRAFVQQ